MAHCEHGASGRVTAPSPFRVVLTALCRACDMERRSRIRGVRSSTQPGMLKIDSSRSQPRCAAEGPGASAVRSCCLGGRRRQSRAACGSGRTCRARRRTRGARSSCCCTHSRPARAPARSRAPPAPRTQRRGRARPTCSPACAPTTLPQQPCPQRRRRSLRRRPRRRRRCCSTGKAVDPTRNRCFGPTSTCGAQLDSEASTSASSIGIVAVVGALKRATRSHRKRARDVLSARRAVGSV